MAWNLKIPKILHVYWGAPTMNYLRYCTLKTFTKLNPDWRVILLVPKTLSNKITWYTYENKENLIGKDFTNELEKLPIERIEVDFEDFGFNNNLSEVHKSDFIRLHQLSTLGGLWSDMDIIYIKSMSELYFNTEEKKDINTFLCNHHYGHSIGFMMASEKNKFFEVLKQLSKMNYDPVYYQTLGAKLYNKYYYTMESVNTVTSAYNIDMEVVYPIVAGNTEQLINGSTLSLNSKTIGVHWYAGHPQWKEFLAKTDGGLTNLPDCIVGKLLKVTLLDS